MNLYNECDVIKSVLYYMNVMPLYDKYLCLRISGKSPETAWWHTHNFECATRRRMNINLILGLLWWTTWRQGWLRQAMRILYKNAIFCTFRVVGTVGRSFDTARRQALIFCALGATDFFWFAQFS